jgi:hypothetical protein
VKSRLEATRVTADANAEMVVPLSLDLTRKTTTLQATAQSLAVSHRRTRHGPLGLSERSETDEFNVDASSSPRCRDQPFENELGLLNRG